MMMLKTTPKVQSLPHCLQHVNTPLSSGDEVSDIKDKVEEEIEKDVDDNVEDSHKHPQHHMMNRHLYHCQHQ